MTDSSDAASGASSSSLAFWLGILPMRALAAISCFILFTMMTMTFVDVMGRYIFISPLPAATEIISFMMGALVFCILPFVCFREEHVTIDLLDGLIPKSLKRLQGALVNVISAGAMLFIAWRLWAKGMNDLEFEMVTDELYMDIWPFSVGMAILCLLAGIAQLVAAAGYVIGERQDPAARAGRAT